MEHAEGNKKIVLKVLSTLLIMYILTGVALFVLAFLLYKMELTENIVTIGITAIYVVSGLLGGIIIGKRMKTRRFLWGIIMGAAYFLVYRKFCKQTGRMSGTHHIRLFLLCSVIFLYLMFLRVSSSEISFLLTYVRSISYFPL